MHNGRKNTYTIEKDGREFVLTTLVENLEEYGDVIMFGRKECVNENERKNMSVAENTMFDSNRTMNASRENDFQSIMRPKFFVWRKKVENNELQIGKGQCKCKGPLERK